eukprot:jgi/Hompol1/6404/HPOL_000947-RA
MSAKRVKTASGAAPVRKELLDESSQGFSAMGLDPRIMRAVAKLGFEHPTLVQAKAIPLALQGKDILARARTGSGKTGAYCIPIIQKILALKTSNPSVERAIRALILVPTRELSEQVHRHIQQLTLAVLAELPDIIVATPARVLAHLDAGTITLKSSIESLVIDEADLILSYGYDQDIRKLFDHLPQIFQSYLMSATLSEDVEELKQLVLRNPAILKLEESPDEQNLLKQYYIECTEQEKFLLTFFILKLHVHPFGNGKTILFVNSIERSYRLKLFLEQFGIKSCTLNSELPLKSRYHIVQEFNRGVYDFIIATDESSELKTRDGLENQDQYEEELSEVKKAVAEADAKAVAEAEEHAEADEVEDAAEKEEAEEDAMQNDDEPKDEDESKDAQKASKAKAKSTTAAAAAAAKKAGKRKRMPDNEYGVSRGIDFVNVQAVINFDLPRTSRAYQHRVGRTARGVGNRGYALSFVTPSTEKQVQHKSKKKQRAAEERAANKIKLASDSEILMRIQKRQSAMGREIEPFSIDMGPTGPVEGFRYRCADAMRAVTSVAVRDARLKELRAEILNSDKLRAHFEANPRDLQALRHDAPLHPARIAPHMRRVPTYLLPRSRPQATADSAAGSTAAAASSSPMPLRFSVDRKNKHKNPQKRSSNSAPSAAAKRKADPLKSLSYAPK